MRLWGRPPAHTRLHGSIMSQCASVPSGASAATTSTSALTGATRRRPGRLQWGQPRQRRRWPWQRWRWQRPQCRPGQQRRALRLRPGTRTRGILDAACVSDDSGLGPISQGNARTTRGESGVLHMGHNSGTCAAGDNKGLADEVSVGEGLGLPSRSCRTEAWSAARPTLAAAGVATVLLASTRWVQRKAAPS
jgi:hypothetical protein